MTLTAVSHFPLLKFVILRYDKLSNSTGGMFNKNNFGVSVFNFLNSFSTTPFLQIF